jgi:hypothetical protein
MRKSISLPGNQVAGLHTNSSPAQKTPMLQLPLLPLVLFLVM